MVPRPAFIERGNRGAEHIGPEDTFDCDYGVLLERLSGKWVASPWGDSRLYFEGPVAT
jgi:hypothetical protein